MERLPPADLVVLTPFNVDRSAVEGTVGAFRLTPTPKGGNDIQLSSIYRFKGLDAKAVVVVEVSRRSDQEATAVRLVFTGKVAIGSDLHRSGSELSGSVSQALLPVSDRKPISSDAFRSLISKALAFQRDWLDQLEESSEEPSSGSSVVLHPTWLP